MSVTASPRAGRARALDVVDAVLDAGSFRTWDTAVDVSALDPGYREALRDAAATAGTDEAVLTGEGTLEGRRVAVVVGEFAFLGGSIGRAAAARIVAAVERATAERLPLLASTASGGTRMQEGSAAFVQMIPITRAVMAHRAAGLPYLVHLRHPTTGGVYASWGSLGQIVVGEPGALVGFLGPKVYRTLRGEPFPPDVQTSENLVAKGVLDAVVPTERLRAVVADALHVMLDPADAPDVPDDGGAPAAPTDDPDDDVWASIEATRADDRIGVRDLLAHAGESTLRLRGTQEGERDAAMLVVLTRLAGVPCVLVGQDRTRQTTTALGPAAFREARRAMALADELRLPLVTVVDTPGADLSVSAEEGALAGEIARCIAGLTTLTVPSVSVILGQGCGGGALALLGTDRVVALEHAWLSPLPPEGASAIVHGDVLHAAAMARTQRVGARDLHAQGVVHELLPEPGGRATADLAVDVARAVARQLATIEPAAGVES